jgi:hypothetical protein
VKKRLLVLTRYTRDGASSRLRTMQYRPWLEGEQFDVEYLPFFDRQYLRQVYGGSGRLTGFLGSLVRRLRNSASGRNPQPRMGGERSCALAALAA